MRLYAAPAAQRGRQITADAAALLWVVLWVRIAWRLHDLVARLAAPGSSVEEAGNRFAGAAGTGREALGDLPAVGAALGRPFEAIASAGEALSRAGTQQQEAAAALAMGLALLVGGLPVLWLVSRYVPRRLRWVRAASAAERLRAAGAGPELFALRALVHRPLADLARVATDPYAAFARGDHEGLAALELAALGLAPAGPSPAPCGPPAAGG